MEGLRALEYLTLFQVSKEEDQEIVTNIFLTSISTDPF